MFFNKSGKRASCKPLFFCGASLTFSLSLDLVSFVSFLVRQLDQIPEIQRRGLLGWIR